MSAETKVTALSTFTKTDATDVIHSTAIQ